MSLLDAATSPRDRLDDPEALMDQVWGLVARIRALATDPERYRVELIEEGAERGDLNLIEIGLRRFRDVTPLEDDDD
jgi:hypothetical protein